MLSEGWLRRKGIYSTADLIDRAENALSAELRAVLPQQSIIDFRDAGKCLALDLFYRKRISRVARHVPMNLAKCRQRLFPI